MIPASIFAAVEEQNDLSRLIKSALMSIIGGEHRDYKYTVELAEKYRAFATGVGVKKYIRPFFKNIAEKDLTDALAVTQVVTPSIISRIRKPAYKALRAEVTKRLKTKGQEGANGEEGDTRLQDRVEIYYGGRSLKYFMDTIWVDAFWLDPNSFQLVDWKNFDEEDESAKPYPVMIPAQYIHDFSILNDEVIWLMVKKGENDFIFYSGQYSMILTRVDEGERKVTLGGIENEIEFEWPEDFKENFRVDVIDKGFDRIHVKRVGNTLDPVTSHRTCISMLHPAMPRLTKSLKVGAEVDFSMNRHSFPQLMEYVPKCQGAKSDVCKSGKNTDGGLCTVCNGTGAAQVTSSKDRQKFVIPRDPKDMLPLDKYYHYRSVDTSTIELSLRYLDQLGDDAHKDVWSTNTQSTGQVQTTATEYALDWEGLGDSMYPMILKNQEDYKWHVELMGEVMEVEIEENVFQFSADLKLETNTVMIERLKKLEGCSPFIVQDHELKIAERLYRDSPTQVELFKKKLRLQPFAGMSAEMVKFGISSGNIRIEDSTLWMHYEMVWAELQREVEKPLETDDKTTLAMLYELSAKYLPSENEMEDVLGEPNAGAGKSQGVPELTGSFEQQLEQLFTLFNSGQIDETSFYSEASSISGLTNEELKSLVDGSK